MLKDQSIPFVSTWNECLNTHWFNHSRTVFQHPGLTPDEKFLWMWLATTQESADEATIRCSFSYEQLSTVMNQPCEVIHRHLFVLKSMGFLRGPLPITYTKIPMIIAQAVREVVLCVPSEMFLACQEALREINEGVVFNVDRREYLLNRLSKHLHYKKEVSNVN